MSLNSLEIGQLVKSAAGRDNGRMYVVIGFELPRFVLLVDGRDRGMNNPKKKSIRHVTAIKAIDSNVADKLYNGKKVTNEEIRHAIALLCAPANL